MLAFVLCACACGEAGDEEHERGVCADIEAACGQKDDGTPGPIADCHELAHEGGAERCAAEREACLLACQ